ncbi:MAG: 8-amino-7-oxononanoate synthase [Vicingus serpentipes]|nr:8-amino-7-oxononanoate synthase [Vicingus serpentipes]
MKKHNIHIQEKLDQRKAENAFRELKTNPTLIDFCSNDYLGLAKESTIHSFHEEFNTYGATGSRLISGNHTITEELEKELAVFYNAPAGLVFNSGYNANVGLFSCVPQRGDTIIYDELIHASIRDGIRLSLANSFAFKHNNITALEEKLKQAKGNIYIAVESIYSMDGDQAPLKELVQISKQYHAALIVDEAHAIGVFGSKGEGLVSQLGLDQEVFAKVITFGKALGTHGAIVLGSNLLRGYLINFSRAFIYTTALPLTSIVTIKNAHQFLTQHTNRITTLHELIQYFKAQFNNSNIELIKSDSAIQCIIIPENNQVKSIAEEIQQAGFDVRPILSPTVPKGKERLRICLHSFNTKEQINQLTKLIINA